MVAIVFDGREFARLREVGLRIRTYGLKGKGITPKLASLLVSDDPAGKLYVSLKKRAAQRVGAILEDYYAGERLGVDYVLSLIDYLNRDETVHGVMIQLPLPRRLSEAKRKILESIDPRKDVDGLRSDSPFMHPTAMAVVDILKEALKYKNLALKAKSLCIVGSRGMVGRALTKYFMGKYEVSEVRYKSKRIAKSIAKADILISATGDPGIIKPEMVKKGAIVIDVGSPKGDVDPAVVEKASFFTPVPGGVGPVTVTCLLENLIRAAGGKR